MCSAPNVYMFVYILIGTHMVPLTWLKLINRNFNLTLSTMTTMTTPTTTVQGVSHYLSEDIRPKGPKNEDINCWVYALIQLSRITSYPLHQLFQFPVCCYNN